MGSSRLPGKHMRPIEGRPMIAWLIDRMKASTEADVVCVATTEAPADAVLEDWSAALGVACYRGSVDDVLGRVLGAARSLGATRIVEITGDCPLADPGIVDAAIRRHRVGDVDYVANILDALTFPIGLDVQVYATDLLAEIDRTCQDPERRVDVTPDIYGQGHRYRLVNLVAPRGLHRPQLRLCVDYQEDLELIRAVARHFGGAGPEADAGSIVAFLDGRADLAGSNVFMPGAFACPSANGTARHEEARL